MNQTYYDFSNDGQDWICTQTNSRELLTMEYRKQTCPELPYYAVERAEYYRFCRAHVEGVKRNEGGTRECSAEKIFEVVEEFYNPSEFLHRDHTHETIMEEVGDSMRRMAKEILALRERVEELQKVVDDV